MYYAHFSWSGWLRAAWPRLTNGEKLVVPWSLPHPSDAGFSTTTLAEDVGQVANWAVRLSDGSRIHVHEFGNGQLVAHRDPTDPARGPLHAVFHWLFESPSGKVVLGVGAVALLVAAANRSR